MAGTFHYQPNDLQEKLESMVNRILQPGKGIFSADETSEVMAEKMEFLCLTNSKEIRNQYSQLRYTLDCSMSEYISAVVMTQDDLSGTTDDCEKFIDLLKSKNIAIGVNACTGSETFGCESEKLTQGLDGLFERCGEFNKMGVWLVKWRIEMKLDRNTPSSLAIHDNANTAARFASICQANGLVPLIEIDIPSRGNHCIYSAQRAIENVLSAFCKHLHDHNVFLEGVILSPVFAAPGSESSMFCDASAIACATVTSLRRSVPGAIAGLAMLSSGLPLQEAINNLKAINDNNAYKPWPITFNFGSQHPDQVLAIWQGKPERVKDAQNYLLKTLGDASQALAKSGC